MNSVLEEPICSAMKLKYDIYECNAVSLKARKTKVNRIASNTIEVLELVKGK